MGNSPKRKRKFGYFVARLNIKHKIYFDKSTSCHKRQILESRRYTDIHLTDRPIHLRYQS